MATANKNLNDFSSDITTDLKGKTFGIVVAEWNEEITKALHQGAYDYLIEQGVWESNIVTKQVPGSFELTFAAQHFAKDENIDAIICLGCVIKGETKHDEYISNAVGHGLTDVSLKFDKPVIFGLLTTNTHEQAIDRCGGKHGNKGTEAAMTAVRMLGL